jgi:hypothetical protein
MSTDIDFNSLFADVESHPLWQKAAVFAHAPPPPSKDYGVYPLAWLARVLPVVLTPTHLAIALLLYGKCLRCRSQTVALSTGELKPLGISRYAKYRALTWLRDAGVVAIESRTGRSMRVTLLWFP